MEKGIAFTWKGEFVRGTFDGKYTVIRLNAFAEEATANALLRRQFQRGNCLPIPADAATNGFPELVETKLK